MCAAMQCAVHSVRSRPTNQSVDRDNTFGTQHDTIKQSKHTIKSGLKKMILLVASKRPNEQRRFFLKKLVLDNVIVYLVVYIDKKKLFSLVYHFFIRILPRLHCYLLQFIKLHKWNFKNYFNCPKNTSIFHFILGSDGFLHIYRIKRTNKNDLTLAQKNIV